MKKTTIYLEPELLERLHKRTEETGAAMAVLIRRAITAYLKLPYKKL